MNDERQLIDRYVDGDLTPEEESRLGEWLAADGEHIREFVRETHLHRQLREAMLARRFQDEARAAVQQARQIPFPFPGGLLAGWLARQFAFPSVLRHVWLPLAACLVLMAGAGAWFFGPTRGEPVLAEVQGTGLSLERAGQPFPASDGTRLQSGDLLRTPENVTAAISFAPEKTRITIQPGTELKLAERTRGKRFTLRVGKLEASVARQRPFRPMVILTPQAEARVLGTRFTLTADTKATHLEVMQGKVRLTRVSDGSVVKATARYPVIAPTVPATGSILHEYWTNVSGVFDPTWDLKLAEHPDGVESLALFEARGKSGDNFGERIRGYVHPPRTGDYTFWIAGDGFAIFSLSRDDQPRNKVWIATCRGPKKQPREWTNQGGQQSSTITLTAGRKYYIEAVQNEAGKGEHHLAVAWQGPDREREVILGDFLSPFETKTTKKKGK